MAMVSPGRGSRRKGERVRRIGFWLGATLGVIAAAALVAQLLSNLAVGGYLPVSMHAIWSVADPDSLAGVQRLAEDRLPTGAWPWIAWALRLPAWLVAGLLALPLLLRRRQRRGFD